MAATVWGVPASSLYQYVLQFYMKEKEHIHLEYSQRMELLALFKQVKVGPYSADKDSDTGYFDVVGADRRKAWKALGAMSHEEAQSKVVQLLEGVCPGLKEVVLSHVKEEERLKEVQKRHKENGESKESHKSSETEIKQVAATTSPAVSSEGPHITALAPAALWCNPKAARHFIAQLREEKSSTAPLTLAPGETVAVQVPTSPQASALFWEFVTESGDIGFGLSFQGEQELHQLLPVTVRDCSQDLVLGSHQYQDKGIYTLEFANSHSTVPKVVHYRVFYQT